MRTKIKFTSLDFKGFEKYLFSQTYTTKLGGILDYKFRFENGFGASVAKGEFTYGGTKDLFELGVIKFDGNNSFLVYDTPITDEVIGWLTNDEVLELLERIKNL
jgi:hypothetical protein